MLRLSARVILTASGLAACVLAACVDSAPAALPDDSDDGGGANDGATGGDSALMDGSMIVPCTANAASCKDDNTLTSCNAAGTVLTTTPCAAGCSTSGAAHCETIVPSPPAASSDLTTPGTMTIHFPPGETRINTDTGAIAGAFTRSANTVSANVEVNAGIAFHQNGAGVGIFAFADLTVANGATVKLIGTNAVSLVSAGQIAVSGVIEARPMDATGAVCPASVVAGPGGFAGGVGGHLVMTTPVGGANGGGAGGGVGGQLAFQGDPGGGGGAGYAAGGGMGTAGCHSGAPSEPGGAGGAQQAFAFVGGSGGGGGGSTSGIGGGGGGALQLVAATVVTIGDGTSVQGINVGGCGGGGGAGSGGGGAGGTLLIEAPFVQINAQGVLAANGGGGGGNPSGGAAAGMPGALGNTLAYGAGSSSFGTNGGGNGGAGATLIGSNSVAVSCQSFEGYGAGGAAGRIQMSTRSGMATINANAIVSPSVGTTATTMTTADVQ